MVNATYDFSGMVCLVTGGASGMGKVFAETIAGFGASIAIADINRTAAQAAAAEISQKHNGAVTAIEADATSPGSVRAMVQACLQKHGRIDALVNSIGIGAKPREGESPHDVFRRVMDVNINGVYNCCIAAGETMVERKKGRIINIASMSAHIVPAKLREGRGGEYGLFAYTASKGAVLQLTRSIAALWAQYGILANCVSPGYVNTPMTLETHSKPEVSALLNSKIPLGYIASPEDIAGAVCYLLSDESRYMTGQSLILDGGYTCL